MGNTSPIIIYAKNLPRDSIKGDTKSDSDISEIWIFEDFSGDQS